MNRLDDVIMSKPSDLRKIVSIIDFFNEMCDFSAFLTIKILLFGSEWSKSQTRAFECRSIDWKHFQQRQMYVSVTLTVWIGQKNEKPSENLCIVVNECILSIEDFSGTWWFRKIENIFFGLDLVKLAESLDIVSIAQLVQR